ncbi:MAG: aminodeoxychorismate/anthranilate synthase component II [Cyclobacteriaceae bacterium]|nr:aminodeoxychorismate/anthranilate synthase component II [Cyclobacteriaceae bacterium]
METQQNSKILVLDNYDSFTYNLVYLLKQISPSSTVDVYRNDEIPISKVQQYDKILLSPGPSLPKNAGILKELIEKYADSKSILGVCLGHQAIAEVFGASLFNMKEVLHGYEGKLKINDSSESLFHQVEDGSRIGQYHSWSVDADSIPDCLKITAESKEGHIMGVSHTRYDVKGLQFHPESIMTEYGMQIIKNWLYK